MNSYTSRSKIAGTCWNLAAKRSRLPPLVNVSHSTLDGAIELAREGAASGASSFELMPPSYYRYSQEAIRAFHLAFAAAVGQAAPIYICDGAESTNALGAALAEELLATGRFAGIHDSRGSLECLLIRGGQAGRAPFALLTGQERTYIQAKRLGAHGLVSSAACAVPELVVALDQAIRAGPEERAARLQASLIEFLEWIEIFPRPAAIKEAAKQRQLDLGVFAAPLGREEDRKLGQFREWFRSWLPDVLRECRR